MIRFFFFILFIFIVLYGHAQTASSQDGIKNNLALSKTIDSLKKLINNSPDDTTEVKRMLLLSSTYQQIGQRDSVVHTAQKALNLSEKLNYSNGQVRSLSYLVQMSRGTGNYTYALHTAVRMVELAEPTKDTALIYMAYRGIALIYKEMRDMETVLQYANKLKQIVHSGFYKDTMELKERIAFGYAAMMGDAFFQLNQVDSAFFYTHLAYKLSKELGELSGLAITTGILAELHLITGKLDSTEHYLAINQKFAKASFTREDLLGESYLISAKLFDRRDRNDSALHYGKMALRTFQKIKNPVKEIDAADYLNKLFFERNNLDSAYKYLHLSVQLKDSLFNQDQVRQLESIKFNELLRQQQIEQAKKEAQLQYASKMRLYAFISGTLILLLVVFILYRNNRQKAKANFVLQEKQEELQRTLAELKSTQAQLIQSEKMASLGELTAGIAHEIQNPLNFVNNFSEVNTELIDELKAVIANNNMQEANVIADDIKENEQKINHHGKRADAIVKGMLQHSRSSNGQKEPTDINSLADEYLRLAYHGLRAKEKNFNVTLKTDYDECIGNINIIPQDIGRVILNLITNAFYAVNEKSLAAKASGDASYEPTVWISTKKWGDQVLINVNDNGNGIPQKAMDKIFQPFFTTKPTGEGTGLGLSISYDIVKAHGGEMKVNSVEGKGTEFKIHIPLTSKG
jgi:two-component system, NtrC family, sensor kinase